MTTYIYFRSTSDHEFRVHSETTVALAKRYGLTVAYPVRTDHGSLNNALNGLIGQLRPMDTVIVPDVAFLADLPSELLDVVSRIVGKGARLLSVNQEGEVDLIALRRYSAIWLPLEETVRQGDAQLAAERKRTAAEIESAVKQTKDAVFKQLMSLGVDLNALLGKASGRNVKVIANPSRARDLRAKRRQLELTGTQAGQLVVDLLGAEKAISKDQVSKMEKSGEGPLIDTYQMALNVAVAKKAKAATEGVSKPASAGAAEADPTEPDTYTVTAPEQTTEPQEIAA